MFIYLSPILTAVAGIAIVLFGRKLFWLYLMIIGYLVGFDLAEFYFDPQPLWLHVLCGFMVGIAAAVISVYLQYAAIAIAGFLGGSYMGTVLFTFAQAGNLSTPPWFVWLAAGLLGTLVFVLLFDVALIMLSSIIGAIMIVESFPLNPAVKLLLFILLASAGIAYQNNHRRYPQKISANY